MRVSRHFFDASVFLLFQMLQNLEETINTTTTEENNDHDHVITDVRSSHYFLESVFQV
jgi:hypothetical protein